jgi:hypothetical protein
MTHSFLSPADVRARVANKGTRFATVTFQKKDGTLRTKNGLFKPLSHIKGTGRKTPDGYIAIWSPNEEDPRDESKGKWGCFSVDKVIDIK